MRLSVTREVEEMFHAGFAVELAKTLTHDRIEGSGRHASRGEAARIAARRSTERSTRAFEQRLSVAGAIALLALVLVGPVAVLALAATAIVVVGSASALVDRRRSPEAVSGDRWQVWRNVEPDPEFLRGRAT